MEIELVKNGYSISKVIIQNNNDDYVHTHLNAIEAKNFIDSNSNKEWIILDVREDYEYCDSHIPSAINYPWNSGVLIERYYELPKDKIIFVISISGSRSHSAASFLDSKGFSSIIEIEEGMNKWSWSQIACYEDMTLYDLISMLKILMNTVGLSINYEKYDINKNGIVDMSEVIFLLRWIGANKAIQ